MSLSFLLFVVVVALFAWRGFRSGLLKALARVLAVVAGYAAAIVFGGRVAGVFEDRFGLQGLLALGAASAALFVGAAALVTLLFWILQRFLPRKQEVSIPSAVGGGVVGGLVGVLFAIVIVWAFAFVRDMAPGAGGNTVAGAAAGGLEAFANRVAGRAVSTAMSAADVEPEIARFSGAVLADPAEMTQRTQRLMESPELQALIQDPRNRQVLDSGNAERVQELPAFRALVANPDLVEMARIAGYADGPEREAELAAKFTDIWGRTQRVKNDPRVREIVNDPEFRAAVESGNPVALLGNRQLFDLAGIIFADDSLPDAATQFESADPARAPTKIYQWTDSSGRTHFSDQEPGQ